MRFIVLSFCGRGVSFGLPLDFGLKGGQRLVPELVQPFAQRPEAVGIDVIDPTRALGAIGDEAGVFQDLEVL
ncbi:MAG TPA: hypothetical protein VKB41_02975 [Steroidobacteraceae bacterium]|nr:hypothetical protein [Steroidobacteraceae bacterium]